MFEFYHAFESSLLKAGLTDCIPEIHRHIEHKRPSADSFIAIMRENGFAIKDVANHQFDYRFTDGTAMLNHYFIRLAFMDSWKGIVPHEKLNEVFIEAEQQLNGHASLTGGLKLSIPYVLINAIKQ